MSESLFVYGTLKPGEVNHHYLSNIKGKWQKAWVRGQLFPQGLGKAAGYPAIIINDSHVEVDGWLLSSNELSGQWVTLDAFEGEGYERIEVIVRTESNECVKSFIYALARSEYV